MSLVEEMLPRVAVNTNCNASC